MRLTLAIDIEGPPDQVFPWVADPEAGQGLDDRSKDAARPTTRRAGKDVPADMLPDSKRMGT